MCEYTIYIHYISIYYDSICCLLSYIDNGFMTRNAKLKFSVLKTGVP